MKVFGFNVVTGFPSPCNNTEMRFYGMNNTILCLAALLYIFMSSTRKHGDAVDYSEASLIIRFFHLGSLLLLLTLGPNLSPMALVARVCAVYGIGNVVEPVGGSAKFFSQCLALFCVTISIIGEIFLGPKAIPSLLPTFVLILCAAMDSILGFCVGCWMYKIICGWAGINYQVEFTGEELKQMYHGWPMIPRLSWNVITFRKMLDAASNKEEPEGVIKNEETAAKSNWVTECSGGVCKIIRKEETAPIDDIEANEKEEPAANSSKWITECSGGVCKIVPKNEASSTFARSDSNISA